MPEYIDCLITISNYAQAQLKLGDWTYVGKPELDPAELENELRRPYLSENDYGEKLFNALFPENDDLLAGYREAMAVARHQNKNLRLILDISTGAPALHAYEWERMYDSKLRVPLARSSNIVFSRYVSLSGTNLPQPLETRPNILIIVSNPSNLSQSGLMPLAPQAIAQTISDAVRVVNANVQLFTGPVTGANIRQKLVQGNFDTVHLHGHALVSRDSNMIRLVLENEEGEPQYVDEQFLTEIFGGLENLRLVNLTACNSGFRVGEDPFGGLALALIHAGCPAVVAMRSAIGIQAAECFTDHFYKNLALTGLVDAAANEARRQVWLSDEQGTDWSVPVNFVRLRDGRAWKIPANYYAVRQRAHDEAGKDKILQSISPWINRGRVVPIIGPDINRGQLLSNEEVTDIWVRDKEYIKYNYPSNDRNDLPRVARFVEVISGFPKQAHMDYVELLKNDLLEREKIQERTRLDKAELPEVIARISERHFDIDKDNPHRILADLPISTYLTINPDNFMAQALKYVERNCREEVCFWQDRNEETDEYQMLRGEDEEPLVFYLYGSAQVPESLVLTEDDHLDFLRAVSKDKWRIPMHIRRALTESILLFLGFNVRDLNFRVLLKGVVETLKENNLSRIIVLQIEPGDDVEQKLLDFTYLQNYLREECSSLKVIPCLAGVREFLIALRDR
jgi:hypothetical protein